MGVNTVINGQAHEEALEIILMRNPSHEAKGEGQVKLAILQVSNTNPELSKSSNGFCRKLVCCLPACIGIASGATTSIPKAS